MNVHDILLAIQYITVVLLFVEIIIVLFKWKNSIHTYLFLAFIATFICNLGYLFELNAESEEVYNSAFQLSYVGKVWVVFAFFLFAAKICGIKIPKWLMVCLGSIQLVMQFYYTNEIVGDLLLLLNAVYILLAFFWVLRTFIKTKEAKPKMRFLMLVLAFGVQIVAFIIQTIGVEDVLNYYDLTMPTTLFSTIFILIGILGFDLLGTEEIARDFALDRISEGIIVVDNNGRIRYYNEPVTKLYPEFDSFYLRKNNKNTSGKTPYNIVADISDAAREGNSITINERIYSPEENELMYQGENYGKLYALVDDTEHFRYMEELQEQRDIAHSANEAKSKFLASMSHEIRTPINAMLGMDEMILRESQEKEIRSYASDIMSAGRTLLSLINDILDLSKVEEGKMEIIPVQYDLSSLVNDLVNMINERAKKKGLKLNVSVDDKIPNQLIGDEIRIRQCVMNLLTNAVKYTEQGEVTLSFEYKKEDDKHITLIVKVEDTGIGMKPEDMENLFSPYKRIEEKRNRAIEGTGLGMSITRQLLELMGSELNVQSVYGKGSTFSFALRQEVATWDVIGDYSVRYDEESKGDYEYHELFHAPLAKILVVDDTKMNLVVINNLLKQTGIGIDTCMTGKEAIELADNNQYDVFFIDHMMPDMDGIETLEHIKDIPTCRDIPAVALTANAVSGAREMYKDAGFTDYMSKPIDGDKLEKLLYDLLPDDKLEDPGTITTSTSATPKEVEKDVTSLPSWLADIEEIDEKKGLKNAGSVEGYMNVLSVFYETIASKSDEIKSYYNKEDWENYTVKVHALKSSARIIGDDFLSELAEKLEDAGKREDITFIRDNTDKLLKEYRSLKDKLALINQSKRELKVIRESDLKNAYMTMYEMALNMDYSIMKEILKELRDYKISEEDRKVITEIEDKLMQLDWDGITEAVKERV